jgi:hypothetical protein
MNALMPFLLLFAVTVCPLAALLFVVRLVVALFSAKVSEQVRRHPMVHAIWGCFAFVGVLVFLGVFDPAMWPPRSVERREQRAKVLERIQSAGGWTALQKDCEALAERYRDSSFQWLRGFDTNALPHSIATLNPWEVRLYSPQVLNNFKDEPQVPVVHIKVFGIHSTGGHSIPYFGLEVVCATNAGSYRPQPARGGVSGNHYDSYKRVTNTVYEIY